MLARVSHRSSAPARRSAAPAPRAQRRSFAAVNPVSPSSGSLQQIDDAVYGRLDDLNAQLKDLKSKNQKVSIDKYNEVLGANIFAGNIGGIVESVDSIVKDGVAPNNTTVRLLNFFFGKTDNFVKGEALLEKIEDLHHIPKKVSADIAAAVPAGAKGRVVSPAQAAKVGSVLAFSDANGSELATAFGAWHVAQASKKDADKKAHSAAMGAALKTGLGNGAGAQLAAALGSEVVPAGSFEVKNGKKTLKDAALAAKYKTKVQAVKQSLAKSKATISAVAKYLGSQPYAAGSAQVNFANLVSSQRVFQNTHGELKKWVAGVRAVAVANLIIHGAPALPDAHPFPAFYLSNLAGVKAKAEIVAEVQGKNHLVYLDPAVTAANAVKPILETHERWFADYYTSNDDLKTY